MQTSRRARIVMAIAAGNIDGFTLMTGVTGTTHQTDTRMTVDATHPGQVVSVGRHALDMTTIGQSQTGALAGLIGNIDFRKSGITQRYAPGAGVTAETPSIGNAGGESRVRVLGIVIYMAGQATTAAVPHYVVTVLGFGLTDMATGALLSQH